VAASVLICVSSVLICGWNEVGTIDLARVCHFVCRRIAWKLWPELTQPKYVDPAFRIPSPLELASLPTAAHF